MILFDKIKLIIWDLDETIWQGTLSDNENIYLNNEFISFINDSLDRGIVHSVCSKNDFNVTKKKMIETGLWELFVFPSINWSPKGDRIKQIIEKMNLRAENVLFVDDNISNLHEAQYFCSTIQICTPEELKQSIDLILIKGTIDTKRPRLLQYRLLEEKERLKDNFSSNEEFLLSCNIQVTIHNDCMAHLDRIHDLIMRSNQLNYTKFRQNIEDLTVALSDKNTQAAYITVTDSFGDYGIVGFYMIVEGKVIHYLFSCRTLGMLIEQYVYIKIGCPKITVIGDVITELNSTYLPPWINNSNADANNDKLKGNLGNHSVLFKGPCDISQIFSFIEKTPYIKCDFTYVNDTGMSVEGHNHTSQIVTALKADKTDKKKIIDGIVWFDEQMLNVPWWHGNSAIFLSTLSDGNLGIYKHKETGWHIALCEKYYDLTDKNNWNKYLANEIFTSEITFTEESLSTFAEKFEYIDNCDGNLTIKNLDIIYQFIDKETKLILVLGSEIPFLGKCNPSYHDRHIFHKTLNDKLKKWAVGKNNVFLIETSNYITSQSDYLDTINHYQKKVYYQMAHDLLPIINDTRVELKMKGKEYLYFSTIIDKAIKTLSKLLKVLKRFKKHKAE